MPPSLSALRDGLRLTALRKPRGNPALYASNVFICSAIFYLLVEILRGWMATPAPRIFVGYGIVTVFADILLTLVAALLMTRLAHRPAIVWAVAGLALIATVANSLIVQSLLEFAALWAFRHEHIALMLLSTWLSHVWWLFVLIAMARWLGPRRWPINIASAILAFLISAAPWWALPNGPIFIREQASSLRATDGANVDDSTIGNDAFLVEQFDPEYVMYDQERLVDAALVSLKPRVAGKTNLYVVAFAGDGSEDVFRNETDYVERLFGERFDAAGHIVVLQNNPATVDERPLATLTNLRWTLDGIAERMDPAEDILLVYLTSHGSKDHQLYVDLDPLPLNQITPQLFAAALQTSPAIRWKVLIVNACYSGGFIDALRDDSSLVIAAARFDRTSFGCGTESEITYFGKAFLAEALNKTTSIPDAFAMARDSVAEWEQRDEVAEQSEPQMASSRSIEAKLESWRKGLPNRPALPFTPSASSAPPTPMKISHD